MRYRSLCLLLLGALWIPGSRSAAQDDAAAFIARIEAPQIAGGPGLDGLTLQEVMQRSTLRG